MISLFPLTKIPFLGKSDGRMQEAQVTKDMQSLLSQAVHQMKSCQMVWLLSSRTWWSDLAEPMSLWIQTGDGACLPS